MEFRDFRDGKTSGSFVDFRESESSTPASDELIYFTSYLGKKVMDAQGKHEGIIKDLLFSKIKGKIELALVKFNTWKNKSGVFLAVPFKILEYRSGLEPLLIKANDKVLENAPIFEKANLNEIFSRHYDAIANYWGGHLGSF